MTQDRRDTHSDSRQDDSLARLLKLAGPRPQPPTERAERVRTAVHAQWRHAVETQRRPSIGKPSWWAGGFAVAAALVLAIAINTGRDLVTVPGAAATIDVVVGVVQAEVPGRGTKDAARGLSLSDGSIVQTGADGRVGLRLRGGQSLRVDTGSRVLLAANDLVLQRGAVYIDSSPDSSAGAVHVVTPYGVAKDVGTQFEVRMLDGALRIRVREGLVTLTPESSDEAALEAVAGEQLRLTAEGSIDRQPISVHGPQWTWVTELAPAFSLEGKTLANFLTWICRENGWRLRYVDNEVEGAAGQATLYGSIEGLNPEQALAAVMRTAELNYSLDEGVLTVGASLQELQH